MIRYLLLLAFSVAALGLPQDDFDPMLSKNMCFFGRASRQCMTKCQEEGKEPVCHEASGVCGCKEKSTAVPIHVERVETPAEHPSQAEPDHQDVSTLHDMNSEDSVQPTSRPIPIDEPVIPMKDYCFFGEYPSLACKSKCSHVSAGAGNMVAYCQDDAKNKTCLCREKSEEDNEQQPSSTPDISDYCWFGEFPSTACHDKCGSDEAYCEQRHCLCKSKFVAQPEEPEGTPSPEEEQSMIHTLMIFVHKEGLDDAFNETMKEMMQTTATPPTQEEEEKEEDQKTPDRPETPSAGNGLLHNLLDMMHNKGFAGLFTNNTDVPTTLAPATEGQDQPKPHSYWDYRHLAALAIAVLIAFLILLELYSFYSKRKRGQNLQTVFKTHPNQNQNINKS